MLRGIIVLNCSVKLHDFVHSFEEHFSVTAVRRVQIANSPASVHTERNSAPFGEKFY